MGFKIILKGIFLLSLYKLGLTPESFNRRYKQRQNACSDCPLSSGLFCSKKRSVSIIDNKRLLTQNPTGIVTGCGCIKPIKQATKSPCPLDKWVKN